MAVNTEIYDKRFFENTIKFEAASAKPVVDILNKYFHPKSVIDIGCGAGIYLREFALHGIEIEGYDGSLAAVSQSLVGEKIRVHDLTLPLVLNRHFDLVVCIEVAEHLEKEYADILVDTLCLLGDVLIFTAATPGQGPKSIGHVNEQSHQYWIDKFNKKGMVYSSTLSCGIREDMIKAGVVWWVSKNLMIFQK